MSCGIGHRCGSDLALLWLWRRPAATGLISPLAWEPLYATDVALKKDKKKKKTKKKFKKERKLELVKTNINFHVVTNQIKVNKMKSPKAQGISILIT